MTLSHPEAFIYFRAPHVSVYWDDVVRCVVLERTTQAAERDLITARSKILALLRTKRAKRCLIQTVRGESLDKWVADARAAGLRALAIVVANAADVTIDFRASLARIAAGDVAARHFDRVEHARLWLVTAASARHTSKPIPRVSGSMPRVSIPPRISIRPGPGPGRITQKITRSSIRMPSKPPRDR
jgi:hypothetical protein